MSLFDILRYGSTDLSSAEELADLPDGLLNLYWEISWPHGGKYISTKHQIITHLIKWYNNGYTRHEQILTFKEALKGYADEFI